MRQPLKSYLPNLKSWGNNSFYTFKCKKKKKKARIQIYIDNKMYMMTSIKELIY